MLLTSLYCRSLLFSFILLWGSCADSQGTEGCRTNLGLAQGLAAFFFFAADETVGCSIFLLVAAAG